MADEGAGLRAEAGAVDGLEAVDGVTEATLLDLLHGQDDLDVWRGADAAQRGNDLGSLAPGAGSDGGQDAAIKKADRGLPDRRRPRK